MTAVTTFADLGRAMATQEVITLNGSVGFVITTISRCDGACPVGPGCVAEVTLVAADNPAVQRLCHIHADETLRIAA